MKLSCTVGLEQRIHRMLFLFPKASYNLIQGKYSFPFYRTDWVNVHRPDFLCVRMQDFQHAPDLLANSSVTQKVKGVT